jgi:hypothetical protein
MAMTSMNRTIAARWLGMADAADEVGLVKSA